MLRAGGFDEKGLAPHTHIVKSSKLASDIKEVYEGIIGAVETTEKKAPENLIFIDDHPDIHLLIKVALKKFPDIDYKLGYSCADAKALINNNDADALVCDYNLKDETGEDVLALLKGHDKEIPFVFLTAESSPSEHKRLIGLGAKGVLEKPIKPMEFVSKLSDILD